MEFAKLAPKLAFQPLEHSGHMGMLEDKQQALHAIRKFVSNCLILEA
jgi:hypothetical protein